MGTVYWLGGAGGATTDASNTANWSGAALPANGDDVYIEASLSGTQYAITTGLSSLAAVALTSLNISDRFTSAIGTSSAYFQIKATTVNIGYKQSAVAGSGSPLIRLNLGSGQSTINVFSSSSSNTLLNGPIEILGTHASNVINNAGKASIAGNLSEVSTVLTANNQGTLKLGSGCTLTTINQIAGSLELHAAATTINSQGGATTTIGTGAITTVNLYSGSFNANATGTITTLNIYSGTADFSGDPRSKTITNTTLYSGARLNLNNGILNSITLTNPLATLASPGQYSVTPWTNSAIQFS